MRTDLAGADVAAAMGRDLPAPIRLRRRAGWLRRLLPGKRRQERARGRAQWALDVCAEAAQRNPRSGHRSDVDAITGDTDRALGPGWREST